MHAHHVLLKENVHTRLNKLVGTQHSEGIHLHLFHSKHR